MKTIEICLFGLLFLCYGECAKILGIFNFGSYSHYTLGKKLLQSLAERGHEVTMLAPYKLEPPPKNWRNIYFKDTINEMKREKNTIYIIGAIPSFIRVPIYNIFGYLATSQCLQNPDVQQLINSNETFDLIVMENFYNDALLGFAHRFNAPYILLSTMGASRQTNGIVGNPGSPAYIPDLFLDYGYKMNFWQRVYNTLFYMYIESFRNLVMYPRHVALMYEYFPDAKMEDLYYNASLMFINSHISIQPATPTVPNMINIGGFHIDPPKKLPQDLQKLMEEAKEGVIFFSLGSNVQAKEMPGDTRNAILRSFSKLKQRVIWKWENESLPNQPPNVQLGKWFPQQDILAHPNVVLFISHCGLLSIIEAVHYGVPVLGLPVFAEQLMNAAVIEENGSGLSLPLRKFTEEEFTALLNELLSNPKYRQNAQIRSTIMKDQQNTPMETALFWTEYVIRHRGAPHLKSVTLNLKWYQYLLLDVIAFLILVSALSVIAMVFCVKRLCCKRQIESSKKSN